jgi:hypothetical protein
LDIDRSIHNIVSPKQHIRSGELKRGIEEDLGRKISYSTFSSHIQKMSGKKELDKDEKIIGRSKYVFYSVPTEIKKQEQLRIIRTDPKSQLFKQIFTNLFLRGIIEGQTYATDDLDGLLREIGATRKDLIIDHIKDEYDEYVKGNIFGKGYVDYQLPVFTITYYRPISHVRIIESTSYRQNVFYRFCKEYSGINFIVPGISINDFTNKYYTFKVKSEDAEEAFMMAVRSGLIKPIIEFRNETQFVFTDDALNNLISYLYSHYKIESQFSYYKWNYLSTPTEQERERKEMFFSDKKSCEKFFNRAEINRFNFKKEHKAKGNFTILINELEKNLRTHENLKSEYFKYIREKYDKTIKEYAFLLDGIFKIVFPLLL